jgi:hypothetical protein
MSRKSSKAAKLKRNKKVRKSRRAAKSKWKWVIPTIIFILMALVTYYKIALTREFTAKSTLYNEVEGIYMVTEECVTGANKDSARFKTKLLKNAIAKSSEIVEEVLIIEGCDLATRVI